MIDCSTYSLATFDQNFNTMKALTITIILGVSLIFAMPVQSQIKLNLKKKLEKKINKRADKKSDDAIDKGLDKVEGLFKKKEDKDQEKEEKNNDKDPNQNTERDETNPSEYNDTKSVSVLTWSKFDFVPGDKVFFEDSPSANEENGEFPSRWDLVKGNVEIADFNNETVIYFLEAAEIVPYVKNSDKAYLPEVFTLEFDCYFQADVHNQRYTITLFDAKNQKSIKSISDRIWIYPNRIKFGNSENNYPGESKHNRTNQPVWRHISLAYTKGKLKIYMDDTRLINIPHLNGSPIGITLGATSEGENTFLKNIRLAEGGVKYYDRVLQEGKIIVNGIKFDINKATLKPESMGPINEIFELLQENSDLCFSIEGHTDSDGEADFNMKLSDERAKAVKDKLTAMGIDANRLTTKGWGESKPIDSNTTAEGKANNRRVEFVKF